MLDPVHMLNSANFGKVPIQYGDVPLDGSALTIEPESGVIALRSKGVLLLAHLTREQTLAVAMVLGLAAEQAGADMARALEMLTPEARAALMSWKRSTDSQVTTLDQAGGHA